MKYTKINAMIITIDNDFFFRLEQIANKWSLETKSSDFLDFCFSYKEDFKRIIINLLSDYEIERDYFRNTLSIKYQEEIPTICLSNQYILIRDKGNLKRLI